MQFLQEQKIVSQLSYGPIILEYEAGLKPAYNRAATCRIVVLPLVQKVWQQRQDSNLKYVSQSHVCSRYTTLLLNVVVREGLEPSPPTL